MRESDLQHLACPRCRGDLDVRSVADRSGPFIHTGELGCRTCGSLYAIVRGIPRFVSRENYASGFGLEWTIHAKTQYDSHTGLRISEGRFFGETGWPRDLTGQMMLEVGSGSGRFTEQAASTGAFVVSLDYSYAVEANYASNGKRENVLVVQGDIYSMPVRTNYFDKLFCFGVLQHTPDVRRAFFALPPHLKPGGQLVVDVYKRTFCAAVLQTKYYVRWLTRDMEPAKLYRLTKRWVDLMWPVSRAISRIPRIGHSINWRLLVADDSRLGLSGELLKEWTYLNTFDMVSPRYDSPQHFGTVRRWFEEAGLQDADVRYGYSIIQARGTKPAGPVE